MKLTDLVSRNYVAASEERTTWPTYDGAQLVRHNFVTSSEAGDCLRKIWFGKDAGRNGFPPKGDTNWGFFARGHNVEAWLVDMLRYEANLEHEGEEVEFMYLGEDQVSFWEGNQSGTPDGVMRVGEEYTLLEFKSVHPNVNKSRLPKHEHKLQVIQNIDLVNACLDLDIKRGIILYINSSHYQTMHEYVVEFDPKIADELMGRAGQVMSAQSAEELPAEGMFTGGCKFCSFTEYCNAAIEREAETKKRNAKQEKIANDIFR